MCFKVKSWIVLLFQLIMLTISSLAVATIESSAYRFLCSILDSHNQICC